MLSSNQQESPSFIHSTIKNRWTLVSKLGQGAFGQTYMAIDKVLNKNVAIKIEQTSAKKQVLKLEVVVLKKFQDSKYSCRFYGCGRALFQKEKQLPTPPNSQITMSDPSEEDSIECNYMVMQMLGKNLAEIRKSRPQQKFSLTTTALLGRQILNAIHDLHLKGYLHRDIKPSNFAMGIENTEITSNEHGKQRCYMIDFGLARRFLGADGRQREERTKAGFRGTARYASLNAHHARDLGRKDDLISMFYVLVEFACGSLPWKKERDKDKIEAIKSQWSAEKLIQTHSLPPQFLAFYNHLSALSYNDSPNYDYLDLQLKELLLFASPDVTYDWIICKNEVPREQQIGGLDQLTTITEKNIEADKSYKKTEDHLLEPELKESHIHHSSPILLTSGSFWKNQGKLLINDYNTSGLISKSIPMIDQRLESNELPLLRVTNFHIPAPPSKPQTMNRFRLRRYKAPK